MGKTRLLVSAVLMLVCVSGYSQYRDTFEYADLYDSENVAAMKEHVRTLSSAMMEGRAPGSEGERMAAEYVESQFEKYGLDILSPADGDVFGLRTDAGDTLTSRNVVAYVQGYDRTLRDHIIVIGARLDNIGSMMMTVDGEPREKVFYGANGNASGLSVMLELASMIQSNSMMLRRSVVFVAFGASTERFAGSWYFLNRSFSELGEIDAMINLDMLGTGYNGFYAYTSSNEDMNAIVRALSAELQPINPELVAYEPYPSDHRTFYAGEIPSVMFTTGRYSQHNTEKDTQSIIDYINMERELEYLYNFTMALVNYDGQLAFSQEQIYDRKTIASDDVVSYYDCDQRPTFLNSADPRQFLEKWVYQYLKYPESEVRNGIQGRVMVEFIINTDGKVSDVRVTKGVSPELDDEAVRVISASPKWKPGKVKGEKVRCSLTIPVEFRLEKKGRTSNGIRK